MVSSVIMGVESLKAYELNTQSGRDYYQSVYNQIGSNILFNSLEFVLALKSHCDFTRYFVYYVDKTPLILMLFHYRPVQVKGELTEYFDVISPYGYSGPVYSNAVEDRHLQKFWDLVDSWYRSHGVVSEFIRFGLGNNHEYYTGEILPTLKTIKGKIVDPESQWSNFKKKVRNNVRKALKNNLQCEIYHSDIDSDTIREFYEIYIATLKRHKAHKRYFYPIDYFENIAFRNRQASAVALVRKDGIAISAEFLLLSKDTVYSYLGGTSADYFALRPNDLLKKSVLDWARVKGFTYYNLGGGQANEDSLHQYKRSFFPADDEVVYYTGRKIIDQQAYDDLVEFLNSKRSGEKLKAGSIREGFFPLYRLED